MVVCIIAEGSYPYVTGGVSSWIHQLISSLPSIDFKVLSIMPDYKIITEKRYPELENIVEVKTIYLNDFLRFKINEKKYEIRNISKDDQDLLENLLSFKKDVDLKKVISILNDKSLFKQPTDFLKSDIFWNKLEKIYKSKYKSNRFNEFFWTYRGIFISLIHMVSFKPISADIYHSASAGYAGFVGSVLQVRTNKPFIITEHGIYPREREEEILKASWVPSKYKKLWVDYFYFLSKIAYEYSNKIITLFNKNQEIQHSIGASKSKTSIIPNGVDLERLAFYERDFDSLKESYLIGAVVRVTPIKDVMTLIRVFNILYNEFNDISLVIIGPTDEDEDYYDQCRSLIKLLKLENAITFTGRADVIEYYRKIDCLVLTSISEGQPLVILEAMAVGLPIVSTDVGSCRELLMPDDKLNRCGYITPLVNPPKIARSISEILRNKNQINFMVKNGRRRVEEKYSKKDFIAKYKKIYLNLGG